MDEIKKLLRHYGIKLELIDLDIEGYYEQFTKTMFVNKNMNEFDQIKSIYHELGHGVLHNEISILYKMPVYRSKMEDEADRFMIEKLLDSYMDYNDIEYSDVNPVHFIEICELHNRYEDFVKNLIFLRYSQLNYYY